MFLYGSILTIQKTFHQFSRFILLYFSRQLLTLVKYRHDSAFFSAAAALRSLSPLLRTALAGQSSQSMQPGRQAAWQQVSMHSTLLRQKTGHVCSSSRRRRTDRQTYRQRAAVYREEKSCRSSPQHSMITF